METKNRKFVIIRVDTNDGDIESDIIEISEEQAVILNRVANGINEFEPYEIKAQGMAIKHEHNFPTGECLRTDMGEMCVAAYYVEYKKTITLDDLAEFLKLVPYVEYGFHSIIEIRILAVIGDIKLI